jgi:dihydroxyacetone kinase-like predicted kinase
MGELLDAASVRRWCRLAADALGRARVEIDELNIFPVPDGDTGTNLHMTALAAAEAADSLHDDVDAARVWRATADGALSGAHGNSGVILSQILRAFGEVLGRGGQLGEALRYASQLAYEAVSEPMEGTMLTVLRVAAAVGRDSNGPAAVARTAVLHARLALKETTEQLDVLARSGMVDAGAAGLCVVLETLAAIICEGDSRSQGALYTDESTASSPSYRDSLIDHTYGYEVEYLIEANEETAPQMRAELNAIGDSLVIADRDGSLKIHIHTKAPGAVIEAGIRTGQPHQIRVTYLGRQCVREREEQSLST